MRVPASVPADSPRTGRPRSAASLFVNASAIWERPALWTQTKRTVFGVSLMGFLYRGLTAKTFTLAA